MKKTLQIVLAMALSCIGAAAFADVSVSVKNTNTDVTVRCQLVGAETFPATVIEPGTRAIVTIPQYYAGYCYAMTTDTTTPFYVSLKEAANMGSVSVTSAWDYWVGDWQEVPAHDSGAVLAARVGSATKPGQWLTVSAQPGN